jgi:hypothetical protein
MSTLLRVPGLGTPFSVEGDVTTKALKVAPRWPEADGFYFHSSRSGALAGAAAASVVWALRWTHATKLCVIDLLRLRAIPTTPFTAAQEWGFDAVLGRSFSVAHTGGTQYLPSQVGGFKKRASYPTSNMGEIRMATTAAFTGGTVTTDASEFISDLAWELVAGATVARSRVAWEKDYTDGVDSPIILVQNEGILVRPVITLGAGGVIRLVVEAAWHEVDPAKL